MRRACLSLLLAAACSSSARVCADALSACAGACIDLQTDVGNCGACGHACSSGQSCEQGACKAPACLSCRAPPAPTNLVAAQSGGLVTLTWSATPGAQSYLVSRAALRLATVTAQSFADTPGPGSFSYAVVAQNQYGQSAPAQVSLQVLPAATRLWPREPTVIAGRTQPFETDAPSLSAPDCGTTSGLTFTAPAAPATCRVLAGGLTATVHVVAAPGSTAAFSAQPAFTLAPSKGAFSFQTLFDFNHDGRPDVILAWGPWPPAAGTMQALQNDGAGHFTDVTATVFQPAVPAPEHGRHFASADFNGDGVLDLFVANHGQDQSPFPGGQSLLLMGNAQGQLVDETSARLPLVQAFTHDACAGDIDGDGDVDLYLANIWNSGQVGPRFYLNDGTGHFTAATDRLPAEISALQKKYTACRFVDVDHSGRLALVLGAEPGDGLPDVLLHNDGTGHFTYGPALPARADSTSGTVHVETADLDRDGWPDLILTVTNRDYTTGSLQLLLNRGGGQFIDASAGLPTTSSWFPAARPADFDGAGWPGFAVARSDGQGAGTVVQRPAGGGPQAAFGAAALPAASDALPGDLDGDGDADLFLVLPGAGHFQVLKNARIP